MIIWQGRYGLVRFIRDGYKTPLEVCKTDINNKIMINNYFYKN